MSQINDADIVDMILASWKNRPKNEAYEPDFSKDGAWVYEINFELEKFWDEEATKSLLACIRLLVGPKGGIKELVTVIDQNEPLLIDKMFIKVEVTSISPMYMEGFIARDAISKRVKTMVRDNDHANLYWICTGALNKAHFQILSEAEVNDPFLKSNLLTLHERPSTSVSPFIGGLPGLGKKR